MKIARRFEHHGQGRLVDADVDARGEVVALVELGDDHAIVGPGGIVPFEVLVRWPLVRRLDSDRLLIIDRSRDDITRNVFVVSRSGRVEHEFGVGDAVDDVAVFADRIAVSYTDEGAFGDGPDSETCIAVFRRDGAFEFGYSTHFGRDAVPVHDCCAMCVADDGALWFYPYPDFPLVRLDLSERTQRVMPGVAEIHGSPALTIGRASAFFQGTYEQRTTLLERRFDDSAVRPVGEWPKGRLRGLPGGRFLGIDANAVVVVTPDGGLPLSAGDAPR